MYCGSFFTTDVFDDIYLGSSEEMDGFLYWEGIRKSLAFFLFFPSRTFPVLALQSTSSPLTTLY